MQRDGVIDVAVGTRPEIIKLAPVLHELRSRGARPRLLLTGQHREMVHDLIGTLDLAGVETIRLEVMQPRQRLNGLASRLLAALGEHFQRSPPVLLFVQGDTTSAMCGALAAFHERIPVAHVEAGLRSGHVDDPFPEEMNRQLISRLASWHFCPTEGSAENLAREHIDMAKVLVTGNTSIDTLQWIRAQGLGSTAFPPHREGRTRVLVTLHRRENQGAPMCEMATALASLSRELDVDVVLPLHPSPAVRDVLIPVLSEAPSIRLTNPLDYLDFVATMADAHIVVTDSGGVQEEAPAVATAALVVRRTTERPEAVASGCARLIGVSARALSQHLRELVECPSVRSEMTRNGSPFGDGHAARRIVDRVLSDRPELVAIPAAFANMV